MNIKINPEFKSLIPPLAPEEFCQLEANILRDGCRDPIVIWTDVKSLPERGYCKYCYKNTDWRMGDDGSIMQCGECGYGVDLIESTIVDGHNRYEICGRHKIQFDTYEIDFGGEDEARIWIIQNQFGRRNLAPFVRAELGLKLEPLLSNKAKENQSMGGGGGKAGCQKSDKVLLKIDTKKEIAKASGLSHDTIAKVKFIKENADEATQAELRKPDGPSINRVYKETKEKKQREGRQEARIQQAAKAPISTNIVIGDFNQNSDRIANGSISLIFTDPPYDRSSSPELVKLAAFAAEKLCDGGSLLCYVGQTQIPTALDILRERLRYWWTVACLHSGGSTLMREYGIKANWKAVLWFVKGTRHDNSILVDDVVSGGREKEFHDWQQSQSEAAYWINKLCPKDGIVCDPFLGGGTTGAAAKSLGIKWIGFEIDPIAAASASERVSK